MSRLSPLLRKSFALTLLIFTAVLGYQFLLAPIVGFYDNRGTDRIATLCALKHDRALVVADRDIAGQLESLKGNPAWSRLYAGPKVDKAVLDLETDLRQLIAVPNNPVSMTALKPAVQGSLISVGVKLSLSMTIDQFVQLLERLQGAPRYIRVESLVVQAPDSQVSDTNPMLNIQADVVGFMVGHESTT